MDQQRRGWRWGGVGFLPCGPENAVATGSVQSPWLVAVFNELDTSSQFIDFYIAPDKPHFKISTVGDAGSTEIICPKESDVVEAFTCTQTVVARCA